MSGKKLFPALAVGLSALVIYIMYQSPGISGGDSGDLVTAAYLGGVPHPPGYPFYTFFGHMLTLLPVATVAWRVALLSSIPHAVTLVFLYLAVFRLTKKHFAALFSVLLLSSNYLFFFYSITAEVFALLDLFYMFIFYAVLRWEETKDLKWLWAAITAFGLSLGHHHFIFVSVPGFAVFSYLVFRKSASKMQAKIRAIFPKALLLIVGLVVIAYSYTFYAARGNAIVNWDRPDNLPNIWRLLTRSDYGTFTSAPSYADLLFQRFLSVILYFQFIIDDFRLPGVLLAVTGFVSIYKTKKSLFWLFALMLISFGPLFYFYASFPLANRFMLGTFERFLLPSYITLGMTIGIGLTFSIGKIEVFLRRLRLSALSARTALWGTMAVFFLYPAFQWVVVTRQMSGFSGDYTADRLGIDLVTSLPEEPSILILSGDTSLFIAQYVRYALKVRPDTVILHPNQLSDQTYVPVLRKNFPDLVFSGDNPKDGLQRFVTTNIGSHRIFSNLTFFVSPGYYFVPYGLYYEIVKDKNLPSVSEVIRTTDRLYARYQNLEDSVLARYNHLMLSDIRSIYASGLINTADAIGKAGQFDQAVRYYKRAIDYGGDLTTPIAYRNMALIASRSGDCRGALHALDEAEQTAYTKSPITIKDRAEVYRDCLKDTGRYEQLMREYTNVVNTFDTQLPRIR